MKKVIFALLMIFTATASAQQWQTVESRFFTGGKETTGATTILYSPDSIAQLPVKLEIVCNDSVPSTYLISFDANISLSIVAPVIGQADSARISLPWETTGRDYIVPASQNAWFLKWLLRSKTLVVNFTDGFKKEHIVHFDVSALADAIKKVKSFCPAVNLGV
jgi:hypothetical protein